MHASERNGNVVNIMKANDGQVMIITEHGITIRLKVQSISVIGRNTQGVRLVRLEEGDKVAAIATVVKEEESEDTEVQEALETAKPEKDEE
jgi:DNA gyrase subunit A